MTEEELLRQIESLTTANHQFIQFFVILSVVCIVAIISLIILNNRELKNKDRQLKENQIYLHHIIKAQEEERRRISRELHDTVAQEMKYVNLLATKLDQKNVALEIQQYQKKCIDELRELCYNFAPVDIQNHDLPNALKSLIQTFQGKSNLDISLIITENVDFSPFSTEQLLYFYRIIQECLSNVVDHAKANEVTILFRQSISETGQPILKLVVSNDGCGIEDNILSLINSPFSTIRKQDGVHFGIRSIKERITLLNGKLSVESIKCEGTEIMIEVPV